MKVLAINSSPQMGKSRTSLILNPFLEGIKSAGAEVELVFLHPYFLKGEIKPCCGRMDCWLKTQGVCVQKDAMREFYSKLKEADIWTLATPLYVDGMTGTMKMLLDRIIPLAEPFIELRKNHCRHPLRKGTKSGKIVLVSNCGFYEMDNFSPLVAHIKAICKNVNREFAGALLRPHGPAMESGIIPKSDVLNAAKRAGQELAKTGKISKKTLEIISRPLLPKKIYLFFANRDFKQKTEKGNKK